jgi:hypothetical protein
MTQRSQRLMLTVTAQNSVVVSVQKTSAQGQPSEKRWGGACQQRDNAGELGEQRQAEPGAAPGSGLHYKEEKGYPRGLDHIYILQDNSG